MTGRCYICGASFDLASADGTGKCPGCVGEATKKLPTNAELGLPDTLYGIPLEVTDRASASVAAPAAANIDDAVFGWTDRGDWKVLNPAAPGEDRTVKQGVIHYAQPNQGILCGYMGGFDVEATSHAPNVTCPACRRLLDAAVKDPVRENRICRLAISDHLWVQLSLHQLVNSINGIINGANELETLKHHFSLPEDSVVNLHRFNSWKREHQLHIASISFPVVPDGTIPPLLEGSTETPDYTPDYVREAIKEMEQRFMGCQSPGRIMRDPVAFVAEYQNHPLPAPTQPVSFEYKDTTPPEKKEELRRLIEKMQNQPIMSLPNRVDYQPPLALQVEKLSPKAGDMIVVRVPEGTNMQAAITSAEMMHERFPGVFFVVVPEGYSITNSGRFIPENHPDLVDWNAPVGDMLQSAALASAWPDKVTMADLLHNKEKIDRIVADRSAKVMSEIERYILGNNGRESLSPPPPG